MLLPESLRTAIETHAGALALPELARATERLVDGYRHPGRVGARPFLDSEAMRLAYLAVRMPATYAAIHGVMEEASRCIPQWNPESVLDLMAGPGTGAWAACEVHPEIKRATLIDQDAELAALGQRLREGCAHHALREAQLHTEGLRPSAGFPEADLVVLGYGLCELSPPRQVETVAAAWQAARGVLVLVEPGTPDGFATILRARNLLIEQGATLAAPCPHNSACPMPKDEWCHFARRLPRSRLHRLAKGGALGFEDEKYCCVVATRLPIAPMGGRIVEPPRAHKAAVDLRVCTPEGVIEAQTVPRGDRARYKAARKLAWGDMLMEKPSDKDSE